MTLASILIGLAILAFAPAARGQGLPSDLKPFVRLDYEYVSRKYQNPIMENGTLVDFGVQVEGPTRKTALVGSGTVVTRDGLIVTNFHVYQIVLKEQILEDDERKDRVVRRTPVGRDMLVAEIDPLRPLEVPPHRYRARLVQAYPDRDVALLKISALASGAPFPKQTFSFVALGNPYAIPLGAELRILGYPGKGGMSLTPSHTEFSGFTRESRYAPDGALKTVASIAGGNSGGSALYSQRLIGIPTLVSSKTEKGADFGYIYPVTWALRPLAVAALRDRQEIPRIDRAWLDSPNNTDVTRTHTFLGGTIRSLMSTRPVQKPLVMAHRADRTLAQIVELDKEVSAATHRRDVRKLLDQGLPPEIVAVVLELPIDTVRAVAKGSADDPKPSADAKKWQDGEFFYAFDRPGQDGFFLVAVPRRTAVRVMASADGFVAVTQDRKSGDGLFEDVGAISLAPAAMRPALPGR